MDSPNSNFHFFSRCYGGHSARYSKRKKWRLGMRLNRVLILRCEQQTNNSYRMLRFESFVFTCLTCRNFQCFRNGPVHEFYGLKASQMSKVRASSEEYPHNKSRIFGNRISGIVQWPRTVTAKELTSQQKEKSYGKKNTQPHSKINMN